MAFVNLKIVVAGALGRSCDRTLSASCRTSGRKQVSALAEAIHADVGQPDPNGIEVEPS